MSRVRVGGFSISLDGFGAGPRQSLEDPLGQRGRELHQWLFGTRFFQGMIGREGGSEGLDQAYAHRAMDGFGAFIMGRNMFGPVRGPWPDDNWKGWWGDNPPYHAPTFVLTRYPREPIEMDGGTTFIFVTEGIEAALAQARAKRCSKASTSPPSASASPSTRPANTRRISSWRGRRAALAAPAGRPGWKEDIDAPTRTGGPQRRCLLAARARSPRGGHTERVHGREKGGGRRGLPQVRRCGQGGLLGDVGREIGAREDERHVHHEEDFSDRCHPLPSQAHVEDRGVRPFGLYPMEGSPHRRSRPQNVEAAVLQGRHEFHGDEELIFHHQHPEGRRD